MPNAMTTAEMEAADQAAPLDAVLVDAALGPLRRFPPDGSTARWLARLTQHPRTTGRRIAELGGELAKAVAGTSTVAPSRRDRRFTDPGWTENPILRRLVQGYPATGGKPHQPRARAHPHRRADGS